MALYDTLAPEMPPPAQLTVARASPEDVAQRQIVVSLDGAPFATLLYGTRATRNLSPGTHRLRAHNTLVWRTVDFEALPGEHVRFEVVNRAGPGTLTLTALLGVGPLYVTLARVGGTGLGHADLSYSQRHRDHVRAAPGGWRIPED